MTKPTIAEFFDAQCEKHGQVGWAASHWDDAEQQVSRFEKLRAQVPYFSLCHTILDVGCGQADFSKHFRLAEQNYYGIDLSHNMIHVAHEKYPNINVDVGSVLGMPKEAKYDYVFASGLFGYRDHHIEDRVCQAKQIITKMFDLSKRATIFNMMSARLPEEAKSLPDIDDFSFFDPTEILDFCLQLTPLVKLDHYLPYEFLICITRK